MVTAANSGNATRPANAIVNSLTCWADAGAQDLAGV